MSKRGIQGVRKMCKTALAILIYNVVYRMEPYLQLGYNLHVLMDVSDPDIYRI